MEWYKTSLRRNLVDIHITEHDERFLSEFDAEKYADAVASSGVDTAIMYAGSCLGLCYFPTKYGRMHQNLHGRDMLSEMLAACKKRGLKTVIYFNIWSRWAYDTHPEWRMRDADGRGYSVELGQRFGQCCPNTGYFDYVKNQITQLVTDYESDGLWIDMIGWFDNICYCDACRDAFRKRTGKELPEKVDWADDTWKAFQNFRRESIIRMAKMIRDTAKSIRPGISVTQQSTSWMRGWVGAADKEFLAQSDYLAGDFYCGSTEQSVICKYLNNLTVSRPLEYMVSRCFMLEQHTINKSRELLAAERASAIANNTAFVFIDAIDPVGTVDPRIYREMNEIFESLSRFEKEQRYDSRLKADVAVFMSQTAMCSPGDNGMNVRDRKQEWVELFANVTSVAKTLIEENIAFDVADADAIEKGDYKALILTDTVCLTAAEAAVIRRFVEKGGRLYASRHSSLYSEGCAPEQFALGDVFGVTAHGETPENATYLVPTGKTPLLSQYSAKYPVELDSAQMRVAAADSAEVWATRALPYFKPHDTQTFAAALSDPPGIYTDEPAMVRHPYGKGYCIYSAAKFETCDPAIYRHLFADLVREMIGDRPLYRTAAPRVAETIVWERDDCLLVNLLNFQDPLPPVPLYQTTIAVRLDGMTVKSVVSVEDGVELPFTVTDGYVTFCIPRTDYLSSIKIMKG